MDLNFLSKNESVVKCNSYVGYLLEDLIFSAEVLHHGLLLAVEPPGEDDKQALPGSQAEIHGSPNAAGEQKRATPAMPLGVSIGRNSSLFGIQKVKNYENFRFGYVFSPYGALAGARRLLAKQQDGAPAPPVATTAFRSIYSGDREVAS